MGERTPSQEKTSTEPPAVSHKCQSHNNVFYDGPQKTVVRHVVTADITSECTCWRALSGEFHIVVRDLLEQEDIALLR